MPGELLQTAAQNTELKTLLPILSTGLSIAVLASVPSYRRSKWRDRVDAQEQNLDSLIDSLRHPDVDNSRTVGNYASRFLDALSFSDSVFKEIGRPFGPYGAHTITLGDTRAVRKNWTGIKSELSIDRPVDDVSVVDERIRRFARRAGVPIREVWMIQHLASEPQIITFRHGYHPVDKPFKDGYCDDVLLSDATVIDTHSSALLLRPDQKGVISSVASQAQTFFSNLTSSSKPPKGFRVR